MKKIRANEKKASPKSWWLYGLCTAAMLVLIAAALFLPQIIFGIQDGYRMANTEVQTRNSLDISQLNMSYEQDLNTRLQNYFGMKNRSVTVIDYDKFTDDSEVVEIAKNIFDSDWFWPIFYDSHYTDIIYSAEEQKSLELIVTDWKKYIVYGSDYQDGVALMMWYLDINILPIDTRMRLLVDTESNTVYYMRIVSRESDNVGKEQAEKDKHLMMETMMAYYDFYIDYYHADHDLPSYEEYEKYQDVAYSDVMLDIEKEVSEDKLGLRFYMPFGEFSAEFLFQMEHKNEHIEILMGFPSIADQVSEILQ